MLFPTLAFAIFFLIVFPLNWLLARRPLAWKLFMLAASIEGESTILNAAPIQRAHPKFVENLNALGADVSWVASD